MKHAERVLYALCGVATLVFVLAGVGLYINGTGPHKPPAVFPYGGRCDRPPDALIRRVCLAARELHQAANDGDPGPFCRHTYPRRVFRACVYQVASTGVTYDTFSTLNFNVLYVWMIASDLARVRLRVRTFDDTVGDVFDRMTLIDGWWRVVAVSCASCEPPPPAG